MSKMTFDTDIQIMQDNLCELRKTAGWTAESLARKLGTTKQSVSNLETQKVKLTRMHYIAIRSVFECEMAVRKDNAALRKLMELLFDTPRALYFEKRREIRTAAVSIAAMASAGISGLQLYSNAISLLAPLTRSLSSPSESRSEPSLQWLLELLRESDDEIKSIGEKANENDQNQL